MSRIPFDAACISPDSFSLSVGRNKNAGIEKTPKNAATISHLKSNTPVYQRKCKNEGQYRACIAYSVSPCRNPSVIFFFSYLGEGMNYKCKSGSPLVVHDGPLTLAPRQPVPDAGDQVLDNCPAWILTGDLLEFASRYSPDRPDRPSVRPRSSVRSSDHSIIRSFDRSIPRGFRGAPRLGLGHLLPKGLRMQRAPSPAMSIPRQEGTPPRARAPHCSRLRLPRRALIPFLHADEPAGRS